MITEIDCGVSISGVLVLVPVVLARATKPDASAPRAEVAREVGRGSAAGAAVTVGRVALRFGLLCFGALTTTAGSAFTAGEAGATAAAWARASSVAAPISSNALIGSDAAYLRLRRAARWREAISSAGRGCVVIVIFLQDAAQKRHCEECDKPSDF
ncbi:hypothetical protein [Rhodopseudomonas sp. AAP120]|uniref:hypothetical protein n=1 Tax=Rhodopseudomonas sp. AAP120 TaxID=1523430 RepID=UPI001FDA5012|nr:hypothetical protein [Rhodopseudomonas sp. AAP120]